MDPVTLGAPPSYDEVMSGSTIDITTQGTTQTTTPVHVSRMKEISNRLGIITPASECNSQYSLANLDFFQSQPQIHNFNKEKKLDTSVTEKLLLEKELNEESSGSAIQSSEQDKGYAFVVAMMSFMAHLLQYGVVWTVGVFYVVFKENLQDCSSGQVALISSLNTAVFYGIGPVAGILTNLFGCRTVGIVGGLIGSLGLILSSFANNIYHLYFTFGLMTGIGLGLGYIPSITIVGYYFHKYQSLAVGFAASGVGVGTFIFPPLIRFLQNTYGWRGSILLIGGVSLNLCVCSALFRPIKLDVVAKKPATGKERMFAVFNVNIFKNYSYILTCVQTGAVSFGLSVVYVHLAAFAATEGYNDDKSALLFSTVGICNFCGRLLFGFINQWEKSNIWLLYLMGWTCSGIAVLLLPLYTNYIWLQICAAIFGLMTACFGTILPQLLIKILDISRLTNAYGFLLIFMAMGTLAGGPLAGALFEATNSYPNSLYLGGCCLAVGGLMVILPWKLGQKPLSTTHRFLPSIELLFVDNCVSTV